jgi:signal transduction histidine kinase
MDDRRWLWRTRATVTTDLPTALWRVLLPCAVAVCLLACPDTGVRGEAVGGTPEPVALDRLDGVWWLGDTVELWEDTAEAARTPAEARRLGTWRRAVAERETLRLGRGVLWLRLKVRDVGLRAQDGGPPGWRVVLGHPRPIALTAWVPRGGGIVEVAGGLVSPREAREVASTSVVVPFEPLAGADSELYLRLDTMPLGFSGVITSRDEAVARETAELLVAGLYYGLALGLMLYNAFLFVTLRDPAYAWYLGFVALTVVFFAARNGLIWAAGWTPDSGLGGGALVAGQLIASVNFTRRLLGTGEALPRLDRVLGAVVWLSGAALVVTAIWPTRTTEAAMVPLSFVGLGLSLVAGGLRLRQGSAVARYFMVAWGLFLVGALLFVLKSTGRIPHTALTEHAMQVGSALELLLLSLALADRIRTLQSAAARHVHEVERLSLLHARDLHAMREASARRVLEAQDECNRRLAGDLHDSVGHRFLLIHRAALDTAEDMGEARQAIAALAEEGIQEARELAHGLYPQRLLDLGLEAALRAAAQAVARTGLRVATDLTGDLSRDLDPATRLTVLRVAEEALQNALRHAEARQLWLRWRLADGASGTPELVIEDDGRGLPERAQRRAGLGLRNMEDRALQVGAQLTLGPREGGGTRVHLLLRRPLSAAAETESFTD